MTFAGPSLIKKIEEIIISKIKRLQPNTLNAVRRKRSTRSHTDRFKGEGGPRVEGVRSRTHFWGRKKKRKIGRIFFL